MKYKEYIYLIILLLIASLNFNLFLKPYNLVCGGTQGLSIILNKITNIDNYIIILTINIISLLLSMLFLNKKMTLGLFISTFIYPLFVKITTTNNIIVNNIYLDIILVGIISGITNGLIYKLGFSASGINLFSPLINKYINIKIGTINLIINLIIMLINLLIFGFNNLIYSIIIIIINGIFINLILYKKNKRKITIYGIIIIV